MNRRNRGLSEYIRIHHSNLAIVGVRVLVPFEEDVESEEEINSAAACVADQNVIPSSESSSSSSSSDDDSEEERSSETDSRVFNERAIKDALCKNCYDHIIIPFPF